MSLIVAFVDLDQVSQYDESDTGIDYVNEIDIWARMEFQSRHQISRLRHKKSLKNNSSKSLHTIQYSFRDD